MDAALAIYLSIGGLVAINRSFVLRSYTPGIVALALALALALNMVRVLPGLGVVLCLAFGIILIVRLLWENGELGPKEG